MGRPKMLLRLGGRSLVRRVVDALEGAGLAEVVVVAGAEAEAVADELRGTRARVVVNPDFARGQSTSLQAGLRALPDDVDAALCAVADQPLLGAEVVAALVERYRATGARIVQPLYGGQPGNPVLFDRALFPELLALSGDVGGRAVVARHRDELSQVTIADVRAGRDVDTPAEFEALRREIEGG
jgi:molybdenum cofactor cytidylyltransferase